MYHTAYKLTGCTGQAFQTIAFMVISTMFVNHLCEYIIDVTRLAVALDLDGTMLLFVSGHNQFQGLVDNILNRNILGGGNGLTLTVQLTLHDGRDTLFLGTHRLATTAGTARR